MDDIMQKHQDFSMLSCTEFKNVTFIYAGANGQEFHVEIFRHRFFNQGLKELIDNEKCFTVNYLRGFNVVTLRKGYNINQFEALSPTDDRRVIELTKQLYNERIMGNDENIKQTIVFMAWQASGNYVISVVLRILQALQIERHWTVIVLRVDSQYALIEWLPLNRNIQTVLRSELFSSLQQPVIKNLFDVIKNPDFDIYDTANRWVSSRKNFFTHDCLKEVKTIHISYTKYRNVYLCTILRY